MKKQKTKVQTYDNNKKWAKALKILAPICFWTFLALGVLFFILAIKNSFGNVAEIIDKLNSKAYTGEELRANYQYLVEKYGEWVIGNGGAGFEIMFINIKNAVFSGIMFVCLILSVVFFVSSVVLGKVLLPKISQQLIQDNQDMVNLEVLKTIDKK